MPFNKRTVQPINLSQVKVPRDVLNELECVSNHTFANIIRQLSSLSAHAQDLFDELITDVSHIFQRSETLHGRLERLKVKVTELDATVDEVTIHDVSNRKPFTSVSQIDQQVVNRATMPQSLRLIYEQAQPAPALHLLNPYRDDDLDSMKLYTDPSFFINLWMQSMTQFPLHQQRNHQSPRKLKQKFHQQESIYTANPISSSQSSLARRMVDEQHHEQQSSTSQELIRHRNNVDHTENGAAKIQQAGSPSRSHPHIHHSRYTSDSMQYSSSESSPAMSLIREQQNTTKNFSTTVSDQSFCALNERDKIPVMLHRHQVAMSEIEPKNSMSHHEMMQQTMAKPSTSPSLPPPPPPAPPLPHNLGIAKLATISEINILPPPPDDFIKRSSSPPASPLTSKLPMNIPPAPPLPNFANHSHATNPSTASSMRNSKVNSHSPRMLSSLFQKDDNAVASDTSMKNSKHYIVRDLHSDLLEEIKKGIQLNNRKKEADKKTVVATKSTTINVMSIMEQAAKHRRDKIRPQSESDNDEESSRWDDSD